jgi:hypothetical protein
LAKNSSDLEHLSNGSFQINGFGGTELVCAEEVYQLGIVPGNQRADFFYAELF